MTVATAPPAVYLVVTASEAREEAAMAFRGHEIVATWSSAAPDKASCCLASGLITTATWARGAIAAAVAEPLAANFAASGARGKPATKCDMVAS